MKLHLEPPALVDGVVQFGEGVRDLLAADVKLEAVGQRGAGQLQRAAARLGQAEAAAARTVLHCAAEGARAGHFQHGRGRVGVLYHADARAARQAADLCRKAAKLQRGGAGGGEIDCLGRGRVHRSGAGRTYNARIDAEAARESVVAGEDQRPRPGLRDAAAAADRAADLGRVGGRTARCPAR